jgi:hypothetical protein
MELPAILLCDTATVREGLLHVLGGGLTRLWRPQLPAALNITVAGLVALEEHELDRPHEIHIAVNGPDGSRVLDAMGGFQIPRPPKLETGEKTLSPLLIPLPPQAGTNAWGKHIAEVILDGQQLGVLEFWVLDQVEQGLPGL